MIQRWLCTDEQALEFDDNGAFVLYIDHLAAIREAEERGRRDGAEAMRRTHYEMKLNPNSVSEALSTLPPVGGAK